MQHHQKIVSNGDTSPPFPCCTSAEETGKLLFASCSMSKALNSTLEELKLYIMGIRCNRIHNNKQPGLHWVYLAYADSTQGLIGPWYWCRTPEQESFCWDQTLCDMQSWATVYFANFIYRMGKTQSQIVHHLSYMPVLCLGCPTPAQSAPEISTQTLFDTSVQCLQIERYLSSIQELGKERPWRCEVLSSTLCTVPGVITIKRLTWMHPRKGLWYVFQLQMGAGSLYGVSLSLWTLLVLMSRKS